MYCPLPTLLEEIKAPLGYTFGAASAFEDVHFGYDSFTLCSYNSPLNFGQGTQVTVVEDFADKGVRLCSANVLYFADGTRLTILEDGLNIATPKVAIFPPSKQEINDKKKATLVCLATDFYPDHIKLFWEVNGEERKEGVKTDECLRNESSKRYSLTSRLRVSCQEWFNSKNIFKCSVEFYTNVTQKYAKEIRGGTDCSVSEESYLRSAMAGKSVYILLIFKSALYGFFVMGLMLRNKQVH